MKRKVLSAIAILLAACGVVALAAAPLGLFALSDNTLLSQPMQRYRPQGAGMPGDEILFLDALQQRRELQAQQGEAGGGYGTQPLTDGLQGRVAGILLDMAKSGVLPTAVQKQLDTQMYRAGTDWRYALDAAGFEQVQCIFEAAEKGEYTHFGMVIEPQTGRVVEFWVQTGGGKTELAEMHTILDAYKQWLGLGYLDDWRYGGVQYYQLQQTSEKGLVQVYADSNMGFRLGIEALPSG